MCFPNGLTVSNMNSAMFLVFCGLHGFGHENVQL